MFLMKLANSIIASFRFDLRRLQKKSENALTMFKKTLSDLEKINDKIDSKINIAESQMAHLTELKSQLSTNKAANLKVHQKISEFLS